MISTVNIIQLAYIIPSYFLLLIFVIILTREILINKNPVYNNQFYPFLLYKAYADLLIVLSTLVCSRAAKMNIFGTFFENNNILAASYYLTVAICYTIIYTISLITSFNRFLALSYPFLINYWFSETKMKMYIIVPLIIGIIYGIVTICLKPSYIYLKTISGYIITFENYNAPYIVMFYTFVYIIPIAISSILMNIITIYKLTKFLKKNKEKSSQDIQLVVYSILDFFCFILFVIYNLTRIINFLYIKSEKIEGLAASSINWILDLHSFGLFYAGLILSKPLRKLFLHICYGNIEESIIVIHPINTVFKSTKV